MRRGCRAAGERDELAQRACPAGPRRCRRRQGRAAGPGRCPGCPCCRSRRTRRGAVAHDPRDGGQRLDVVDDGGLLEQAPLGGVRRPLVGLAALALERLDEDGLLAQHVRALDGPDGDRDPVPGARGVVAHEPGLLGREDRALEPRDERGSSPRTARIASVAPIANAAIVRPSMTAHGSAAMSVVSVRDRRVRAVAVGDDVALARRLARRRATSRRSGSPRRRGRAAPTRRRSRWCRWRRGRGRPCAAPRRRRCGRRRRGRPRSRDERGRAPGQDVRPLARASSGRSPISWPCPLYPSEASSADR